ncbi:pyrimidine/purine nucleoside phosphorylase [Reichenbachiella versicolor]|uniref:pyrimidine/purine nucleoside phosphorylase n=1 Tax=Reichenbachiella versicolor TaxID=1821036 RepID=UPI000D6E06F7|nr:pyrimidine/purine nucleoside phosphorylase [Reichenbachiella versicolor]
MISTNEYFDAKVKSLGYETNAGKSTIGVMEPGDYEFGTSMHEVMTVIDGELIVTLSGEKESKNYKAGSSFEVEKDSSFKVKVVGQTSYHCLYR